MQHLSDEWIIGNRLPMVNGYDFQVHLKDGTLRRVGRRPTIDYSSLFFKDCTHPAQNAFCSSENIQAWRLVPVTLN
jgi:hypothetical protein